MSFQNAPIIPARRRYKRLFQDLDECIVHSTEEDDEEVLYERRDLKGSIGRSDSHELVTYSLSDLDLPKPSPAWKETALAGCSRLRCLTIALLMFFTVVILFVTVAGIYLLVTSPGLVTIGSPQNESHLESDEIPLGTQPAPSPQTVPPSTVAVPAIVNYTLAFPNTMTQTTPEFFDLNEDEILDVVVAVTATESDNLNVWACSNKEEMKKFEEDCSRNKGYYSCGTLAVALNGQDGSVLWEYKTPLPIFAITCTHDLNGDGKPDCMLCGRSGFWHAVDGKTGEFIWDVDHSIVMIYHNFYFPLAVGDLDDDGTVDFVNVHGGDPRDKADNHNRPPARFVAVSGRTGQKLLDPLLVPDMKESYMNPIQYRTGDEDFILFGSGGETIEGGLWALTIESLRDKIESYALNHNNGTYSNDISNNPHCREYYTDYVFQPLPKADPIQYTIKDVLDQSTLDEYHKACPKTIFHPIPNVHNLCIYRVVFSPEKGVILPPVIIDMDNDGVEDLVISLYSGHTTVMNGQSGDVIWDRYVPGTESYSIPAPLYYNEDNIPDLLIRVNKGEWDTHYNYSYVGIVDGTNGELLWALNSSEAGFMSGTTLRGEGYGKDALLFLTVGMLPTEPLDKVKSKEIVTIGNMTPHHYRSKRAVNPKDRKSFSPTEELDRLLGRWRERSSGTGTPSFKDVDHTPSSTLHLSPTSVTTAVTMLGSEIAIHSTSGSLPLAPTSSPLVTVHSPGYANTVQNLYPTSNFLKLSRLHLLDFWKKWSEVFKNNPKTNPEDFIREDCGTRNKAVYVYFLTRDMINHGHVQPLQVEKERVIFPKDHTFYRQRTRRHGDHMDTGLHGDGNFTLRDLRHDWGCFNVLHTGVVISTPSMADINGDGEIELVFMISMVHNFTRGFSRDNSPAQVQLRVVTLRETFKERFSDSVAELVDFDSFLPYHQQLWTKYMGQNGDSVYRKVPHLSE